LIGARLTSVQFVLEYLILGFDEKGALTTLVWPELIEANRLLRFGESGYRDLLCSWIGRVITGAAIDKDDTISIQLSESDSLRIPLGSYRGSGERAILTGPRHFLLVY
jgi:hypothetical protein